MRTAGRLPLRFRAFHPGTLDAVRHHGCEPVPQAAQFRLGRVMPRDSFSLASNEAATASTTCGPTITLPAQT